MKISYTLCVYAFLGIFTATAQNTTAKDKLIEQQKKASKRTVLQRFEKKIIPNLEEQEKNKEAIRLKRESILMLIDSSNLIKDKRRVKLKQDVIENPFSSRLKKFLDLHKKEVAIIIAEDED